MYRIALPNFEGPFDLLLYFIKRDELNIYDIPIARMAEEFLSYIRFIQIFDLELAGEFLVMASTLMYIKSQMLLPQTETEDGQPLEDPRSQLVQRLLEYKQFKAASRDMSELAESQRYIKYRRMFEIDFESANGFDYKNSTLFDLISAFRKAVNRLNYREPQHIVELMPSTVEEKSNYILGYLVRKIRTTFSELIQKESRHGVIVCFLAILELMKLQKIFIRQDEIFDDIVIAIKPMANFDENSLN